VKWDPENTDTYRLISLNDFEAIYRSPFLINWHEHEDDIHYFVIGGNHCREAWSRFLTDDPSFVRECDPRFTGRVFCQLNQSEAHVVNVFIVILHTTCCFAVSFLCNFKIFVSA
jgi:hypothetical protein